MRKSHRNTSLFQPVTMTDSFISRFIASIPISPGGICVLYVGGCHKCGNRYSHESEEETDAAGISAALEGGCGEKSGEMKDYLPAQYDIVDKRLCENRGLLCISGDFRKKRMILSGSSGREYRKGGVNNGFQQYPVFVFLPAVLPAAVLCGSFFLEKQSFCSFSVLFFMRGESRYNILSDAVCSRMCITATQGSWIPGMVRRRDGAVFFPLLFRVRNQPFRTGFFSRLCGIFLMAPTGSTRWPALLFPFSGFGGFPWESAFTPSRP